MASRFAIAAGIALAVFASSGVALAQMDDQPGNSFYGDPVLPDPPLKTTHVFAASIATQDVAAVTPAAGGTKAQGAPARLAGAKASSTACSALNPCAVISPAVGG